MNWLLDITMDNGNMDKDTVAENKFGQMDLSMKDTGVMIWLMEEEDLFMPMEMFSKDHG